MGREINYFKLEETMKVTIIHGQSHKSSTYHAARMLAEKLDGEIEEFFLPKDFGDFCIGCNNCFKDESLCPSYEKLKPIIKSIDECDVVILASPVYVFHATGAMKAFLDHMAYRWIVHRPSEKMFQKQGVALSTAAGSGTKSANKDMKDSLFMWGVGKIYSLGIAVAGVTYSDISDKKKLKIENETSKLANKIKRNASKKITSLKTELLFFVMRAMQKKGWNEFDNKYWKEKGWLDGKKPWK